MRKVVFPIAALTVFALSACGGEAPPPQAPPPATAAPTPPPPPAPEANATPDAGAPAAEAKPAEKPPEPAVAVAAMKFAPAKGGKLKAMELADDGSIKEGDKVIGKIANDTLQDAEGNTLATIGKDGTVTITGVEKPLKFSDIGELERDDGMKISVADDGTPTKVAKAKEKPNANLGKFEGFNPKGRRAAALMLAFDDIKKEAAKAAKATKKTEKPAADKAAKPAADKPAAKPAADKGAAAAKPAAPAAPAAKK